MENFPVLSESRNRVVRLVRERPDAVGDVVQAVESDVALVTTVLRVANRVATTGRGKIASVPAAVEVITPEGVERLASAAKVFDFFERIPGWDAQPERFRLHAVATQAAADRIAREMDYADRDSAADLGAAARHRQARAGARLLGLPRADPRQAPAPPRSACTPSAASSAWTTAWSAACSPVAGACPPSLATAIERHHSDDATGEAAIVRLADMLAHYGHGAAGRPQAAPERRPRARAGSRAAAQPDVRDSLLVDGKKRHVDPCPLSGRELDVLKKLAEGKVYKQIAVELACPPARCARTCTTPTPSSAPATALRPCCWPPTAAGCSAS